MKSKEVEYNHEMKCRTTHTQAFTRVKWAIGIYLRLEIHLCYSCLSEVIKFVLHLILNRCLCPLVLIPKTRELPLRIHARHDHFQRQHHGIHPQRHITQQRPPQRRAPCPLLPPVVSRLVRHRAAPEREQQGKQQVEVRQAGVQGRARDEPPRAGPYVERVHAGDGGGEAAEQPRGGREGGDGEEGGEGWEGGEVGDAGEEREGEEEGGDVGVLGVVAVLEGLDEGFLLWEGLASLKDGGRCDECWCW